jgi:hypothetical protein
MIIMNLGIFGENFMNFGEGEIFLKFMKQFRLKRNSLIGWKVLMGITWGPGMFCVQMRDTKQSTP